MMAKKSTNKAKSKRKNSIDANLDIGGNVDRSNIVIGHGNTINIAPEQILFRSLHQLPQPPADFTGRETLIDQLLTDFNSHKGATISGLTGMGGIGKTALGLEVAHKIAENYPDAQIFLDLKGTTEPLRAIEIARYVILSFEPTANLSALDDANMIAAYQSVLHGKKALLFFDNTRSAEQIASLLPTQSCALLVTSRWIFSLPGLQSRRVGVMTAENAKDFLLRLCPRIDEKATALANTCAYLPLALRIAGSFLQVNSDWSIENYLTQLNDRKKRLNTLKESREDAELTTEPDLRATFELSYNQLPKEYQKRWRMLGVFSTSFASNAVQAMWDLEENKTKKLLGLLSRYSLIEFDVTLTRYSLHDLLVDYAVAQMEDVEEKAVRISHSVYYSEVLGSITQMYLKGGKYVLACLRLYDVERTNIETGHYTSVLYLDKNHEAAQACNWYACQGSINSIRLNPKENIKWIEDGLRASTVLKSKKTEATHLINLGAMYTELGEARKAIEYNEQGLNIARQLHDKRAEGTILSNLGTAYKNLGKARKALGYQEQALAIARQLHDKRLEGSILSNLGTAYEVLGEARKAIEYQEQALAIARQVGDKRAEGSILSNLGIVYEVLGEARKDIEYQEQALAIARDIGDRTRERNIISNLGLAYADLGEMHKAINFYEQTLLIHREVGDRRGEEADLGKLGLAYGALGDTVHALRFIEQALKIARDIGDLPGTGTGLGNLGNAYEALGEVRKAIKHFDEALVIMREIEDRRGEGTLLNSLGNAYANLGEVHKAINFYEQALLIHREVGDRRGENGDLGNLGLAYRVLGDLSKAINLYEQALVISRAINDHRSEGVWLGNLGDANIALGKAHSAVEFYEQALKIAREIGDRRNEGSWVGGLGNANIALGDPHRAEEFYEQALMITREIGDQRNEGNWLGSLGTTYSLLNQMPRAIEYWEQALTTARTVGDRAGEGGHLFNMGLALYESEENEKAIKLMTQALKVFETIESPNGERARNKLKEWGALE